MCTVIVAFGVHDDAPLIVAHNRDELLARPSDPVARFRPDGAALDVVGGRDRVSGGSWFAVGPRVLACVTNDRRQGTPWPRAISRGALVTVAAAAPSLDDAVALVSGHRADDVGAFHLLVSDGARLVHVTNAGGAVAVRDVGRGLHVLGNYDLDDDEDPIVRRTRAELAAARSASAAERIDAMQAILRSHGEGAPCVHRDGYGTRSAGVVAIGAERRSLLVTDGPSCTHAWRDESALLREVRP